MPYIKSHTFPDPRQYYPHILFYMYMYCARRPNISTRHISTYTYVRTDERRRAPSNPKYRHKSSESACRADVNERSNDGCMPRRAPDLETSTTPHTDVVVVVECRRCKYRTQRMCLANTYECGHKFVRTLSLSVVCSLALHPIAHCLRGTCVVRALCLFERNWLNGLPWWRAVRCAPRASVCYISHEGIRIHTEKSPQQQQQQQQCINILCETVDVCINRADAAAAQPQAKPPAASKQRQQEVWCMCVYMCTCDKVAQTCVFLGRLRISTVAHHRTTNCRAQKNCAIAP